MIGPLQLRALLNAGVKAFVLVTDELTDAQNAEIVIKYIDKIFGMIEENKKPFIAKIRKDAVVMWKMDQPARFVLATIGARYSLVKTSV